MVLQFAAVYLLLLLMRVSMCKLGLLKHSFVWQIVRGEEGRGTVVLEIAEKIPLPGCKIEK
jgi:hypothetical protein